MSTTPITTGLGYGAGGFGQGPYGNQPIEFLPIGYYLNLLTHQYRNTSPKSQAWLRFMLQKFDDVTTCMVSMDLLVLDIDNATGAQLDQIGSILNVSRTVDFQPSNGVSPVLDDATYKILILATIAQAHWNGRIDALYPIWTTLFPEGQIVIENNQNMTATIVMTGNFSSIVQDLIKNDYIVPRPAGVEYTYDFGTLPYFGFDESPGFIEGFDTGKWV